MTYSFYKKADGIIISYDVTDKESYDNIKNWIDSINTHADKTAARILIGNKIDLENDRKITKEMGQSLASTYGINYFETSAKANIGLEDAFCDIFE